MDLESRFRQYNSNITSVLSGRNDVNRNYQMEQIADLRFPWAEAQKQMLLEPVNIAHEIQSEKPDFEKMEKAAIRMNELYANDPEKDKWNGTGFSDRSASLMRIADDMILKTKWKAKGVPTAPQRSLDGMEAYSNINEVNNTAEATLEQSGYYNVSYRDMKYLNNALNRYSDGETLHAIESEADPYPDLKDQYNLMPKEDQVFYLVSKDENGVPNDQPAYLGVPFPLFEAKEAFNKAGVKNVTMEPFTNGREFGNVYTVTQPDGSTRSFSVYEHRNSEEIIINGKTNWQYRDDELPYAGELKYEYFDSFYYGDMEGADDALASFLKRAQDGTLESDDELVEKRRNKPF